MARCRYFRYFIDGIVNTDVGIGFDILKYPISVRFFGIPTQLLASVDGGYG